MLKFEDLTEFWPSNSKQLGATLMFSIGFCCKGEADIQVFVFCCSLNKLSWAAYRFCWAVVRSLLAAVLLLGELFAKLNRVVVDV